MQIQALVLSFLVSVVVAAPAPQPAAEPQFNLCFDSFDCGLGKACQNGQCVTAPAGSPEAAIASALGGLLKGALPSGFPAIGSREAEAEQ